MELMKWAIQVGGPLGFAVALVGYFYRKDMREMTDQWRGQSTALMDVVKDNTKAMTQLVTVVQSLHMHMRNSDKE